MHSEASSVLYRTSFFIRREIHVANSRLLFFFLARHNERLAAMTPLIRQLPYNGNETVSPTNYCRSLSQLTTQLHLFLLVVNVVAGKGVVLLLSAGNLPSHPCGENRQIFMDKQSRNASKGLPRESWATPSNPITRLWLNSVSPTSNSNKYIFFLEVSSMEEWYPLLPMTEQTEILPSLGMSGVPIRKLGRT